MAISSDCGTWTIAEATWPWPKLFFLQHYLLGVTYADYSVCQGGASSSESLVLFELVNVYGSWVAYPVCDLGTSAMVDSIEVADFGPFYIVSTALTGDDAFGATNYSRDVTLGLVPGAVSELSSVDVPSFVSCCNFRGQLVVGGITSSIAYGGYSDWENLGHAHVAWSGIGKYTFRPDEDPTAGFLKAWWSRGDTGKIVKLHALDERVMVFGDLGLMALEPFNIKGNAGFKRVYVKGMGLLRGDLVAGDENVVFFINRDKDLCMTKDGLKVEVLGYREYIEDLAIESLTTCYVPQKKRFFMSDGIQGYCLTEYGLYSTNQLVTSVGISGNEYVGFFLDSGDYEARLETNTMDFSQRGKKTLEAVEVGAEYVKSGEELEVAVKYKNDYAASLFAMSTWKRLNPNGFVHPIVTADEFRICVRAGDYRDATLNISYLKGRIKMVDKRSIRGLYNAN